MKRKIIQVENCHDCPFRNYSYDDFALGDAESHHCNLLQRDYTEQFTKGAKVGRANYFIHFYKNENVKSKNRKTLDNCPLLEQDINVSLK